MSRIQDILANAQRDVDDYRLTSEERYRDMMAPQ